MASLNLSVYGLARYINQIDEDKKFLDHLGREKTIDPRQDIMWHRTFPLGFRSLLHSQVKIYNFCLGTCFHKPGTCIWEFTICVNETNNFWGRHWT